MVSKSRSMPGSMMQPTTVSNYKRIKKIQKTVRAITPEVNTTYFNSGGVVSNGQTVYHTCGVKQGDALTDRNGDKIRILSIEIRGQTDAPMDVYLVRSKRKDAIATTDFNVLNSPGHYYLTSKGHTYKQSLSNNLNNWPVALTPLEPWCNFLLKHDFPGGLIMEFDGANIGDVSKNFLRFMISNSTGDVHGFGYNIKMTFVDL